MAFVRDIDNQIPIMTSNTTPNGYIASASSEYGESFTESWTAFNGSIGNDVGWLAALGATTGWLAIQAPTPVTANKYTIHGYSPGLQDRSPRTWTVDGWNGSGWDVLDYQNGVTTWVDGLKKEFLFRLSTYTKYRINVTANNGSSHYLAIGEFEICLMKPQPNPISFF